MRLAQAGDVVLLVGKNDRKSYIRTLEPGRQLHTHRGVLSHDDLIGKPLGSLVKSHLGMSYYLLTPTTDELIRDLRRETQIIFPKDAGYIIMKLGVKPGAMVLETGTGSGGLTLALATAVGDGGHVYSYEIRKNVIRIADENLKRAGLRHRVTLNQGNAADGFNEADIDAVFLDLKEPWTVLDQARAVLRGSGMLGIIVPTVNQLTRLLYELEVHSGYGFIEAEELVLRSYKVTPARVRPDERVVGHTGFLIFARAVIHESRGDEAQAGAADGRPVGEESKEGLG